MKSSRAGRLAVVAVVTVASAAALVGCEPSTFHFRPVDHNAGPTVDLSTERASYTLAAQKGEAATATVTAVGMRDRLDVEGADDVHRDLVVVDVRFRNRTDLPVEAPLTGYTLIDDEGNVVARPAVYGVVDGDHLIVPNDGMADARLVFELGPDRPLSRIGSVRLNWQVAVAGKLSQYETKFVRSQPARVYYEPDYYGYYGYPDYGYPYYYGGYYYTPRHWHPHYRWRYDPHPYYLYNYPGRYWCP